MPKSELTQILEQEKKWRTKMQTFYNAQIYIYLQFDTSVILILILLLDFKDNMKKLRKHFSFLITKKIITKVYGTRSLFTVGAEYGGPTNTEVATFVRTGMKAMQ